MKLKFLLAITLLILGSCNLVRLKNKQTAKRLNNASIESAYFDQDSLHIKFWKGGQGPALVFVHGFGGDGMMAWEQEMARFAKSHTVIAYDLLWFGKSYSNEQPTLRTQTVALEKLLKYLKVDSATIIGQSYGGFIALDFATQHPEMMQKLIIANSPGSTFNLAHLDTVCKNYGVSRIDELFVMNRATDLQRLIDMSTYKNPHVPAFLLKQMYKEFFNQHHAELRQLLQTLPKEKERVSDLSTLKQIPTLVLWGENDELFPKAEGEKFARAMNAEFVSIPNCGHAPQMDDHETFIKLLDAFIFETNRQD
jgi:pimeloyl-ACP methyl ester carboxylesterase